MNASSERETDFTLRLKVYFASLGTPQNDTEIVPSATATIAVPTAI